jgi:hypothetical protein
MPAPRCCSRTAVAKPLTTRARMAGLREVELAITMRRILAAINKLPTANVVN